MLTGKTPLFCVFTLILQLNLATAAVAAGCPMNPFAGYPKCNETCSKPPRIPYSREFSCKIGFSAEWYDFKTKYGFERAVKTTPSPAQCKIPVLSAVSLHPLPFDFNRGFSPAFNITFNVPIVGHERKPELKAILLEFQSPLFTKQVDKKYTDQAYSVNGDGTVYRLFDFSKYQPISHDLDDPIKIDYPCLYGLDDCHNGEKIYTITLTSLLSTMTDLNRGYYKCSSDTCYVCSVTYTFSVYTVRYKNWNNHHHTAYNSSFEKWKMTIGTALYPLPNDVYVILEPRSIYNMYTIHLISDGHRRSKDTTELTHIFKEVPPGTYKVQVDAKTSSSRKSIMYTTYHTVVINGTDSNKAEESEHSIITILAASILGVALGTFLLFVLAWFKCRVRKSSERGRSIKQPYIILSNDDRASVKLSREMENVLRRLDINVCCPENNQTILKRLVNENPNATLIILCPVGHETFQFQISKDVVYEQTIESLAEYKQLNIISIHFPYMKHSISMQWEMLRKGKQIYLMRDYKKMIKLLKRENVDSQTLEKIESDLTNAVIIARDHLVTYSRTPTKWPDPAKETTSCPVHGQQHNGGCCPIHQPRMFYLEDEVTRGIGLNNDLTNLDYFDSRPNFANNLIPPSPSLSIKGTNDNGIIENERNNSDSSGYETSRVAFSSDDNNQRCLEDDLSLHRQILAINKKSFSDDETASEEDPMICINSPQYEGKHRCLPTEDTDSINDPMFYINFG